jgi:hypothetical protein
MVLTQDGRCAICDVRFDMVKKSTKPHVDHCHATKYVRGILCSMCNTGIGFLGDSASTLLRAAYYLRESAMLAACEDFERDIIKEAA